MVGGRAQVLWPCCPFPLLMGLQSLLTPTTHHTHSSWAGLEGSHEGSQECPCAWKWRDVDQGAAI